jgi:predicted lactoylglutathione lyase
MIVGDDIFVMLLTHAKFKTFTPKAICDATKSSHLGTRLHGAERNQARLERTDTTRGVAVEATTYRREQ